MKAMYGRDKLVHGHPNTREVVLRFHARDREAALDAIKEILEDLPDGYTWATSHVARFRGLRPGRTPGRKVSATIVLFRQGTNIVPLDLADAETRWKAIEDRAQ